MRCFVIQEIVIVKWCYRVTLFHWPGKLVDISVKLLLWKLSTCKYFHVTYKNYFSAHLNDIVVQVMYGVCLQFWNLFMAQWKHLFKFCTHGSAGAVCFSKWLVHVGIQKCWCIFVETMYKTKPDDFPKYFWKIQSRNINRLHTTQ